MKTVNILIPSLSAFRISLERGSVVNKFRAKLAEIFNIIFFSHFVWGMPSELIFRMYFTEGIRLLQ